MWTVLDVSFGSELLSDIASETTCMLSARLRILFITSISNFILHKVIFFFRHLTVREFLDTFSGGLQSLHTVFPKKESKDTHPHGKVR